MSQLEKLKDYLTALALEKETTTDDLAALARINREIDEQIEKLKK